MMGVQGVVKENKITPDDCAVTKHLPHGLMFKWKTTRPRRHKSATFSCMFHYRNVKSYFRAYMETRKNKEA